MGDCLIEAFDGVWECEPETAPQAVNYREGIWSWGRMVCISREDWMVTDCQWVSRWLTCFSGAKPKGWAISLPSKESGFCRWPPLIRVMLPPSIHKPLTVERNPISSLFLLIPACWNPPCEQLWCVGPWCPNTQRFSVCLLNWGGRRWFIPHNYKIGIKSVTILSEVCLSSAEMHITGASLSQDKKQPAK